MSFFKKIIKQFEPDANEKKFISYLGRKERVREKKLEGIVLMDVSGHHPYMFQSYRYFDYFTSECKCKPVCFLPVTSSLSSRLKNVFFPLSTVGRIYRAIGFTDRVSFNSIFDELKYNNEAESIFNSINKKEDLLHLKFGDLLVGDLIYDTYLRDLSVATLDVNDTYLKSLIRAALVIYNRAEKYLSENSINYILISHSVYIQYGILARCGAMHDIDTYVVSKPTRLLTEITKKHHFQTVDHSVYPSVFSSLKFKDDRIKEARELLKTRFSGRVDKGISYMSQSAYSSDINEHEVTINVSNKNKVIVMLHCFFDSPHIYKGMVFEDFYEWINYTLKNIDYVNNVVYVKPHPNGIKGNDEIVSRLKDLYPKANFLDKNVSNTQILKDGVDTLITVYGTVAYEFAYRGVSVITVGDNPTSAYGFTLEAKDLNSYKNILNEIHNIKVDIDISDIEEFVYMHYFHSFKGRLDGINDPLDYFRANARRPLVSSKVLNDFINDEREGKFIEFNSIVNSTLKQFK